MQNLQQINNLIEQFTGFPPLEEYREPMTDINHAMNYGLAQIYANKGFRDYMQNQINLATKAAALKCVSTDDIAFAKGRILTLKELLVKAKKAFEGFEKINLLKAKNSSLNNATQKG